MVFGWILRPIPRQAISHKIFESDLFKNNRELDSIEFRLGLMQRDRCRLEWFIIQADHLSAEDFWAPVHLSAGSFSTHGNFERNALLSAQKSLKTNADFIWRAENQKVAFPRFEFPRKLRFTNFPDFSSKDFIRRGLPSPNIRCDVLVLGFSSLNNEILTLFCARYFPNS